MFQENAPHVIPINDWNYDVITNNNRYGPVPFECKRPTRLQITISYWILTCLIGPNILTIIL